MKRSHLLLPAMILACAVSHAAHAGAGNGLTARAPDSHQLTAGDLRPLADHGDVDSQFKLGVVYATGNGAQKDEAEAARWFRMAAEQGHAEAQFALGTAYLNGQGVPHDPVLACTMFNIAAAQGHEAARTRRDALAGQLSPAQLTEAQSLSSGWRRNTPLPTRTTTWK